MEKGKWTSEKIVRKIPIFIEPEVRQFFSRNGYREKGERVLDLLDSYIICLSGARGGGKTETQAWLGIIAKILGYPVWSNFPLKFYLKKTKTAKPEIVEAEMLDLSKLFALSDDIRGGLVLIDEYQTYCSKYSFNSMRNRIFGEFWAQIRKRDLSFCFTAKSIDWVDRRTISETDVELKCQDAHFSEGGDGFKKGELVFYQVRDLSGKWTGKMFEDYPIFYPFNLPMRAVWGSYDTRQTVDVFEAMAKLELDLERTIITNKEAPNTEELEDKLRGLYEEREKWFAPEIFAALGITSPRERKFTQEVLLNMGARLGITGGTKTYTLVS